MRPFDEKFSENVREAFDSYREPVDENAWKQMKSRLQARPKKRILIIAPLFARAAAAIAFLMAISGSLWLLVLNPEKPYTSAPSRIYDETAATPGGGSGHTPAVAGRPDLMNGSDPGETGETNVTGVTPETGVTNLTGVTPETGMQHGPPGPGEASGSPELADIRHDADIPAVPDGGEIQRTPPVSDILPVPHPPAGLHPLTAISIMRPGGLTSDLIASEQPAFDADAFVISRNLESLGEMRPAGHRSPVVEISAGSMKTWSPGEIAGGLGYMAGVGGDWKIGRRMSIQGGGMLVYNRFSLHNIPVTGTMSRYSYSRERGFRAAPDGELEPLPDMDISMGYQVMQYQNSINDIEFMALDIPVNFRFTVKETNRNRIFVSAGFSSLLYLQQKYRGESTVLASYYRINPQGHYESATGYANLNSAADFNAFSRFDPAGLLNLSAGYVIRRRNHALIIEPWLKYPTFDITSFNLFIGMTGLSIKYIPDNR